MIKQQWFLICIWKYFREESGKTILSIVYLNFVRELHLII